jgi:serine/threonine protein kinase
MAATGTWLFPSAFSNPLSADVVEPNDNLQATTTESSVYDGHIASFVFLVSGLEKSLRDNSPILFDSGTSFKHPRTPLGFGHSFIVEKAEWESRSSIGLEISNGSKWGKFVALKYVRRTEDQAESTNWKQILLEIRALLHEPIRYHPNIVRLLGLSWGAAQGTRSNLPMLVLELSAFGSLSHLQMNADPFPFKVKKKLCHDVSKGLSILHACGIAHGDLKQENVLIFRNKDTNADVIYTAKLSDFGGSVMDLDGGEKSLHMGTPPYGAPEARDRLDGEGLKQTDVYSLGLLVWRTILDGKPPFECPEFLNFTDKKIEDLKRSNQLLVVTKINVHAHVSTLEKDDMEILDYVFEKTIQAVAQDRSLRLTIAALQVTK